MTSREWFGLGGFVVAVAVAASLGALSTMDAGDQYAQLEQPPWAPPGWLFGPVWTVLYVGIAVAGWLLWRRASLRDPAVVTWMVQLGMNALWSPLFFAWGLRGIAFAWIILLAGVIVATMVLAWPRSRPAAWLLAPYLAWVLLATALNGSVWWLNR